MVHLGKEHDDFVFVEPTTTKVVPVTVTAGTNLVPNDEMMMTNEEVGVTMSAVVILTSLGNWIVDFDTAMDRVHQVLQVDHVVVLP